MSRRRPWVAAVVAVLLLGFVGCLQEGPEDDPGTAVGTGWVSLPDPPLSLRGAPFVVAASRDLLVFGGVDGGPCPPTASCAFPALRDGAALDLAEQVWRPVADLPLDLSHGVPVAWGEDVFVLGEAAGRRAPVLLRWSRADDTWRRVPLPDGARVDQIVADQDRVLLWSTSTHRRGTDETVLTHDPGTGAWGALPDPDLGEGYDRVVLPLPDRVVLVATPLPEPDTELSHPGQPRYAVLRTGATSWRTGRPDPLPVRGAEGWRVTGDTVTVTGGRDVGRRAEGLRAGELTSEGFGWLPCRPDHDDPASGAWHTWGLTAPASSSGSRPLVVDDGWLLDTAEDSWTPLTPPPGAPELPGGAVWVGRNLVVVGGTTHGSDAHHDRVVRVWGPVLEGRPLLGSALQ